MKEGFTETSAEGKARIIADFFEKQLVAKKLIGMDVETELTTEMSQCPTHDAAITSDMLEGLIKKLKTANPPA